MGKFDGILIVSDVDGTFIARGGVIVDRNLEALKYFLSEGGNFTFATGRDHVALLVVVPMAMELSSAPVITSNGGYLYDFKSKEMLNATFLPEERIREAVEFVYNYDEGFGIRYSSVDGSKYCRRSIVERSYMDAPLLKYDEWDFRKCFKVVIRGVPEELDALRPILEERFGGELDFVKSSATLLEMVPRNVNKGNAIAALRDYFNMRGKSPRVYACGDNENDIEMLHAADVAICPSNAIDKIKAISHYTLCSSGEGLIADLIEKIENELI
jgi:Cof subfamily protein (haloacid dehalogenase superfamily)